MSDGSDPYGLDTPFRLRYYARKDKRQGADDVALTFAKVRTLREAAATAHRVYGVPKAFVNATVNTTQSNAVRMMNLARAARKYAALQGKARMAATRLFKPTPREI